MIKNKTIFLLFMVSVISLLLPSCKKNAVENAISFGTSTPLNTALPEASGLEIDANGRFWANNDSGNSAVLFGFNTSGTLEQEIRLSGVDNDDWEDLAMDKNDNLYVGDFGNNDNDRTNLKVYLVPNFSTITSTSAIPEKIKFTFEDQTAFPPSDDQLHFDTEAFIAHNEMLYLFTKDRTDPFQGKTNLYQVPAVAGEHVATLLGSFNTFSSKKEGAITGADISPDGSKVVLISEKKLFLFSEFQTPNFFSGKVEIFDITIKRKFEGIAFKDDCNLFLVNEDKYDEAPQLITIDLCK